MEPKKTIIVVGAAGGIGQQIVYELQKDYIIVAADKNEHVKEIWNKIYDNVIPVICDVLDDNEIHSMLKIIESNNLNLYGLIYAAGVMIPGNITEISTDDWQKTIAVNLTSVYKLCKNIIPILIKGGGGHIIPIASHFGIVGAYDLSAYCVSKAALIQLTKCIALDYGDYGILANVISPGFIDTPMLDNAVRTLEKNKKWMFLMGGLSKQKVDIEDLVGAIVMILNQKSMNGANLIIDGGYTVR